MILPNNEIGISDILGWRECPQRFAYQMRRHTEKEPPEATNESNAYGSAIHDIIHQLELGLDESSAVTQVWPSYASWLDPEDLALITEDIGKYRRDVPPGMKLIASEVDARVPLFVHNGVQIYFRFKLDALYQSLREATVFYHRDYKSSKWPKSQKEVDSDLQMWAYNWAIYTLYPECRSLTQSYEQLRYGNLLTSKNDEQRAQMKAWLIETVTAMLGDETLEPKQNQFCAWCPMVVTCDVTKRSTRYWKGTLAVLAPQVKDGRKTRLEFMDEELTIEEMLRFLPTMMQTRKHIEHVEKELKELLGKMDSDRRAELGWRMTQRKSTELPPVAMRLLHEAMGDSFYEVATISKTRLEKVAGKPELELYDELGLERISSTSVAPVG